MNIHQLRNRLEQQKGRRAQLEQDATVTTDRIKERKRDLRRHEQAREVIREVGLKTQQQLQYHIGDIASLALDAVYDDPYELLVEFVQRRNKTECDIYFERNGEKIDPMTASGGGVVNIASFALRTASWSMMNPRSRNVFILDEPWKNLSADLLPRAGDMLKQLSNQLNLQIIMSTHSEQLMETADRTFEISKNRKGISQVKTKTALRA